MELSVEEQQHICDLEALMQHFNKQGFCYSTEERGNDIHSEQSKKFFRTFFKSDADTLEILENGYRVPISESLQPYEEPNNRSATENYGIIREQITEWLQSGVIERCATKPTCVNPLSVVSKVDWATGKEKHRVLIDMS